MKDILYYIIVRNVKWIYTIIHSYDEEMINILLGLLNNEETNKMLKTILRILKKLHTENFKIMLLN